MSGSVGNAQGVMGKSDMLSSSGTVGGAGCVVRGTHSAAGSLVIVLASATGVGAAVCANVAVGAEELLMTAAGVGAAGAGVAACAAMVGVGAEGCASIVGVDCEVCGASGCSSVRSADMLVWTSLLLMVQGWEEGCVRTHCVASSLLELARGMEGGLPVERSGVMFKTGQMARANSRAAGADLSRSRSRLRWMSTA